MGKAAERWCLYDMTRMCMRRWINRESTCTFRRVPKVRGLTVARKITSQYRGKGVRRLGGTQASLKLLLLLLELLKLGFSVRLVGIETAPAFSETHAESSFTPLSPTLPLLFADRVATAKSQREFVAW